MNKYLKGNAKNITYSLYKMIIFIKQRKLEDQTVEDTLQIMKFGFTAWNLILSIYKSGWDKLTAY